MVTLFAALQASANALTANSEALAVTERNINNLGAPGYARQIVSLAEDGFDPERGLPGGVQSRDPLSARSQFAEQSVWWQENQQGYYQAFMQQAGGVSEVLGLNDVSGGSGIAAALSKLFQSFANWAGTPQSDLGRNDVIEQSRELAATISSAAAYLRQSGIAAQTEIHNTVAEVNRLVGEIGQWNQQIISGAAPDPAAEAQVYSRLEQLSSLVPISTVRSSNGTLSILLDGQIPLLTGDRQNTISDALAAPPVGSAFPGAPPSVKLVDSEGNDITSAVGGGKLAGLLNYVSTFVPSLLGDASQQGDLNRLAQGLADSVNTKLGGAAPLFQYNAADPTSAALSLQLNPNVTAADLAAAQIADPGAPAKLAQIAGGSDPADRIGGQSYTDFLAGVLRRTAGELSTSQDGLDLHKQLLSQAQALRDQIQGVSLEEEAVNLLQYQRAFEAAARVIHVIDDLTQTAISLVPQA